MIFSQLNLIEKIYIVTSFITGFGSLFLSSFVLFKNYKNLLNKSYFLMGLSIALWSFFLFVCHTTKTEEYALFWNRCLHFASILIPISFFNFAIRFLNIFDEKKNILFGGVVFSFILALFAFTPFLVINLEPKFDFRIWPVPGVLYKVFLIYFSFYTYYSLFLFYRVFYKAKGLRKYQLKFVLIGLTVGFAGGSTNFAYFYNLPIPPVGNFFVFLYVIFLAYAIVKYRLMDISMVFTRLGLFIFVYTLVLGVPFFVGFKYPNNWIVPVSIMGVLATCGPYFYLYLQNKAEARLLAEQRQYQATLRNASLGMGQIKDLNHLVRLIVHVVLRAVRIEHCKIFLFHEDSNKYILKASKGRQNVVPKLDSLRIDNYLIPLLSDASGPIVLGEIKQKALDYQDQSLKNIEELMIMLNADVIVPSFIEKRLIAFIVLGRKISGKLYTQDDLSVFSILANQAGLAIENAMFYEKTQKTTEQLFRAEKMATIGTMADGLSHQINNRLHAMGFVAGDALDSVKFFKKKTGLDGDTSQFLVDLEYALGRIQDNVKRGGEIVGGLLRYTRKGADGMAPVDLNELLNSSLEMAQFKIKLNQFELVRNFNGEVPKIKGNFTQLQEVLFNVIDNAYDAMMQRKADLQETGYKARLEVSAAAQDSELKIVFRDNGMGVKTEELQKIFTPFFTTKATSKKGTGLGMYVIRQIIEQNHGGNVKFYSKYKEGSEITLVLPAI